MFAEAIRHVVAELQGADVHAAADVKNLHRVGVWVTPSTLAWDRLDETTRTVTLDLNLIGPPTDALDALDALDRLAATVRTVTGVHDFDAVTYPLSGRTLPGYRAQMTVEVTP